MELFHAHNQWATRPDDERFNSLEDMHRATKAYADIAGEAVVPWSDIRTEAHGDEVVVQGRVGVQAQLTHYSFGQLASKVGAPAGYLRTLPATLAANNLNHGLKHKGDTTEAQLLFHANGQLLLRAATSTRYERVWNHEVIARLIDFSARHGLVPAQATFSWSDRRPGADQDGPTALDPNAEKALYASDHDMFAFVMSPERSLVGPLGETLRRGVFVQNSEVGASSLKLMGFLFRDVCANHIVWGAEQVAEISLRHVGDIHKRWARAMLDVRKYLDGAASLDEAKVQSLRVEIAGTKDDVLDKLFGIRSLGLSRKQLAASYDAVVPEQDGDANTVWGMVQGITRESQNQPYAEDRTAMDRAAGKLMQVAF